MTARCYVFIATSVDGFIAREDGSVDWLDVPFAESPPDEDFGFADFFGLIDAVVLGRNSYEKVLELGEWYYGSKPVIVLSSTLRDLPANEGQNVRIENGDPQEITDRLYRGRLRRLYIDGGDTIRRFLAASLIDEMTITTIPVLLGRGIPLFGPEAADLSLELLESRSYPSGLVQSRYRVRPGRMRRGPAVQESDVQGQDDDGSAPQ